MLKRILGVAGATLALVAVTVLPAQATAGSFRVPSSSEYGVSVWDGPGCAGYRRVVAPGHRRDGRVNSFKVYAKKGSYKLNSGSWRTATTGRCYNVSAAIVNAKAWD